MALLKIFVDTIQNTSLQVGDIAYYAIANTSNVQEVGKIVEIGSTYIVAEAGATNNDVSDAIASNTAMLLFAKDARANISSLAGYYANVEISNDSTDKVELFAISSEVAESSK
jgi:hypothetical protein